ncbi:response regulator [Microcoleus sp. FACHB-1515]|uniref:response regulator n=1 Tax=Cyanophyceae TaxID=3028117 RepID=UPI001688E18D|nr:response regulator [Microcoleus sp. FACHB-1515]MBD2089833.1 response regulator [Microcoleus sp. FACHB-1515]
MKLLVIEDDQDTSELLSAKLSAHRYAVDAIADGSDGLELASQWSYDLIVLDVLLPTLNGVEVCRRLRARNCQTPILMLTAKDANEDIIAGLDAGADDYVAKSCDDSQLLARVRALLRRGAKVASSPVLTWGLLSLDPASAQVTYDQKSIALRPKEYALLELFLRNPQRIFSRSAIIDHLWSMEETPVEGSVTNLIKDLRQRLKAAGMNADFIETVYGLGYRLKTAPGQESAQAGDRIVRERRGKAAIEQITVRFRESLEQRITVLEAAARSIHAGNFNLQQQQITQKEVHKLAGGLGTFGYSKASEIAQAIEQLLELKTSQKSIFANQFSQLLKELKQELALKA